MPMQVSLDKLSVLIIVAPLFNSSGLRSVAKGVLHTTPASTFAGFVQRFGSKTSALEGGRASCASARLTKRPCNSCRLRRFSPGQNYPGASRSLRALAWFARRLCVMSLGMRLAHHCVINRVKTVLGAIGDPGESTRPGVCT
jgi:hypothetical protein